MNLKTAEGVAKFEAIANEVADLVLEFGGALSGEHGDGLVRGAFNEKMFGSELYQAFRQVKRTFDPNGLFNPGRIVDTPPITSHLRYGAGYATPSPATFFDFSDHGGFGRAVEMCSGVGLCRKKREGTMCPSYMVTRDEAHSTRGRANTLRLAMAGQLGDAKLSDEGVHEVLDLCLECRACKSECPVGVDVARFKSEFLAGYWDRHGVSLAAQVFGSAHGRGGLGQPLRAALERDRRTPHRAMGGGETDRASIDGDRCRSGRGRRCESRSDRDRGSGIGDQGNRALLFADTFTDHADPEIGLAAIDVMNAAGIATQRRAERVLRPAVDFAGPAAGSAPARRGQRARALRRGRARPRDRVRRAELPVGGSRGRAGSAARRAAAPRARGGAAVGAVRRVPRTRMRRAAAPRCALEAGAGRGAAPSALPSAIDGPGGARQGAAVADSRRATVVDLDAGCCGMAGSFGYTRDHYDVSRAIAERKLLPAARAMTPGSVLVAAGTSCRHQVADFAGVARGASRRTIAVAPAPQRAESARRGPEKETR